MNVLEVYSNFLPSVGGVQRHMYDLCRCLIKKKHKARVLAWIPSKPSLEIIDEIMVHRFEMPLFFYFVRYPAILYLSFRIAWLTKKYEIDLIHAHSYTLGIASALAGKALHRPVIVTFHLPSLGISWTSPLMSPIEYILKKHLIYSSAAFVCVSKFICGELVCLGFPKSQLKIIHNWLPELPRCNVTHPNRTLQKFDLSQKNFILSVGRLVESHKSFLTLIRAFNLLVDRGYKFDLVIVGSGPDRKKLLRYSSKLGLMNRVHLIGSVSDEDLACLYTKCEMFVLPSRFEGFGLTLLEAMSYGKPVVATKVGGIPEVVEDRHNGLLVNPTFDDIASGMEMLLLNPSLRRHLIHSSKRIISRRFSKANCYNTIEFLEMCAVQASKGDGNK